MSKRIYVRQEYSEEATWREALGYSEPLLVHSSIEPTLDADDFICAGSTVADDYVAALPRKISREDPKFNYM
jgi:hypothetical protein